ncbi:MAG: cytochrome P450 [Pseudomonadota bacterium]|nr:cytochrome P450 [Pseudomonadota bacterium]
MVNKNRSTRKLPQGRSLTPHHNQFVENRQLIYDKLRSQAPRYDDCEYGRILLTKFDDVRTALKNPDFSVNPEFSAIDSYMRKIAATGLESYQGDMAYEPPLVLLDDPDHRRVRSLINRFFTPRAVENMRLPIEVITEKLLDSFVGKKDIDLIKDFAAPLSTLVILTMLGMPEDSPDKFRKWSEDILMGYDPERSPDIRENLRSAFIKMSKEFKDAVIKNQESSGSNLISVMVEAKEKDGQINDLEIISLCIQIMVAGNVTTSDLIGNGLYALLSHRDSLGQLLKNPDLIDNAVEEMLRFDCPISETGRIAKKDTSLNGYLVEANKTITASLSAANHDPEKFPQPHRFNLDRKSNDHLSFGTGIHVCLGAALARLETRIALRELLAKYPLIHLSPDMSPVRRILPFFSGFTSLRVGLSDTS